MYNITVDKFNKKLSRIVNRPEHDMNFGMTSTDVTSNSSPYIIVHEAFTSLNSFQRSDIM